MHEDVFTFLGWVLLLRVLDDVIATVVQSHKKLSLHRYKYYCTS